VRVVILVPYRGDNGGRRDRLWGFTQEWLKDHHCLWPIYFGHSPEGPFNRGAAINDAARKAGEWDVAVVHDADNIADPLMLCKAVERAHEIKGCVYPYETYIYLDEFSTNRLIEHDNWFLAPEHRTPNGGYLWTVCNKHTSGIQAISREAYDKIGGFVELTGWGHEDWVTAILLETFVTASLEHMDGAAYHLYHDHYTWVGTNKRVYGNANKKISDKITRMKGNPARIREYLGGHPIPGEMLRDVILHPEGPRYWVNAWRYLHEHPEIRFAFLCQEDVTSLVDPFPHMRYETLYLGAGTQTLGDVGDLEDMSEKDKKRFAKSPLLVTSVVGGDRTVLLEFCSQMISCWAGQSGAQPPAGELYWMNMIAYSGFQGFRTRRYPKLVADARVWSNEPVLSHPIVWFCKAV
jgi:hypothetical protein